MPLYFAAISCGCSVHTANRAQINTQRRSRAAARARIITHGTGRVHAQAVRRCALRAAAVPGSVAVPMASSRFYAPSVRILCWVYGRACCSMRRRPASAPVYLRSLWLLRFSAWALCGSSALLSHFYRCPSVFYVVTCGGRLVQRARQAGPGRFLISFDGLMRRCGCILLWFYALISIEALCGSA